MSELNPRVRLVVDALAEHGMASSVQVLPESARTAREAADALGVEVGAIVNSLVFDAGGEPVLILTSGAHRVDAEKVRSDHELAGLDRASPEFVRRHTGQAIGGVAPIGHPAPIRTFIDEDLASFEAVWAAAGHPHAVFRTSFDELAEISDATVIEVA